MAGAVPSRAAGKPAAQRLDYPQLRRALTSAETRAWIVVPWWDDSSLAAALVSDVISCRRRGVDVRVIARPGSSNEAVRSQFREAGIELIAVPYVIAKFVVCDQSVHVLSAGLVGRELEANKIVGFTHVDPEIVTDYVETFEQFLPNRGAGDTDDEVWTPAQSIIPPELSKYMDRHDLLNPLQSAAVPEVLSTTGHTMVVAPTSAGKTLVGEVAALRSIVQEGRPAVWLLPARALASEVAETVGRWRKHGIDALELTGEMNIASEKARKAQLWVATTEKLESLYRRATLRDHIASLGCMVIDEVHLVGDASRGATLESLIARLRLGESTTRIVALSATVSNAEELANWFNAKLVQKKWRPTVLTPQLVPYRSGAGNAEWQTDMAGKTAALDALLLDLVAAGPDPPRRPPTLRSTVQPGSDLGSLLVFCGSKNAVRSTAARLADVPLVRGDDRQLVRDTREHGVGIHFKGSPGNQEALKDFNGRRLGALVATSGLSTGVNTPARIVVIRDLMLGMSKLEVSSAMQMLGRAGRANLEPHGFGFLLVPEHMEDEWRRKLRVGYRADSQIIGQIADVLLAEILLGSITSRASAEDWFKGTFAYAQSPELYDVDPVLDELARHRLVSDVGGVFSATELGTVTTRLMIPVAAACGILDGLAALGLPGDGLHAENRVLGLVASSVPGLQDYPVNPGVYQEWVTDALTSCGHGLGGLVVDKFGSQFAAAAAAAALRDPGRISVPRGSPMSRADMVGALAELPRYLNWLGALGALGESTWAPAVAGDLARRLQWWNLDPRPVRGSGRLLWFLEQLLAPENRAEKMPRLWRRGRRAGFDQPNEINVPPRDVDVTGDAFAKVVAGRAHLVLGPPDGASVDVETNTDDAQLMVVTSGGFFTDQSAAMTRDRRLDLPIPSGARGGLAADIVWYTRNDFAYQNLVTDLPDPPPIECSDTALDEARGLIGQLRPAGGASAWSKLHWLFLRERGKKLAELMPQIAASPQLKEVAKSLVGEAREVESQVQQLRSGIGALLDDRAASDEVRSATAVLKSGGATQYEFECVLIALASSLGIDVGMALSSKGKLIALVEVEGRWLTATPIDENTGHISQPLSPATLPADLMALASRPPAGSVKPRLSWLGEFAPGSGEPAYRPRLTTPQGLDNAETLRP